MANPQPKNHFEEEAASFIKEVDENMHLDRLQELWDAYKVYVFAAVAALFVSVAGTEYYTNWNETKLSETADSYHAAIQTEGEAAAPHFAQVDEGGSVGFKALAHFNLAQKASISGDFSKAAGIYGSIYTNSDYPQSVRDLALFMQGVALMGSDADAANSHFAALESTESAYRAPALEMMAYLAENKGDDSRAISLYEKALTETNAPRGVKERAELRIQAINSRLEKATSQK